MKLRRHWPILKLYLEIPFISIRSSIMSEAYERMSYDYVRFDITVWKWTFGFDSFKHLIYSQNED